MTDASNLASKSCPIPSAPGDRLLLAHGEGARVMRRLIQQEILPTLDNPHLRRQADAATFPSPGNHLAFSTDGYVVKPLFFPGGDIGLLAVHGTINDLAVMGAEPLYLSLGIIAEEGLPLEVLRQVLRSVARAARESGVQVVTGDTKVVPRGAADGLFLHTTGIGRMRADVHLGADLIQVGDAVLVSGNVGDHGMTILATREQMDAGDALHSDTAPLHTLVEALLRSGAHVRFLRDATRGGVSAVLHELAEAAGVSVHLEETAIPLSPAVRGMSELLGIDPLYMANEGKLIAVVDAAGAHLAVQSLRSHPLGRSAMQIGTIHRGHPGEVHLRGLLGGLRVLDEPAGALLPRIC
ncbi:MAG: hydrogenase expression/formation protein HypE [Gemmataceae bacterium]